MWGGGLPYRPGGCGPWGERGVGPPKYPLSARGSRGGHYVVVRAPEDCTQHLKQGLVAVCRSGGGSLSVVCRPVAQRAVSQYGAVACSHFSGWFGSAGWVFSAGARRRRMVSLCVTWVSVSCVRAWPHSMEGIQMCWSHVCWRVLQRTRSTLASRRPFSGMPRSRRAVTMSFVELSCRQYQPRGVSRALS